MSIFNTLRISASGLTAERLRMDVVANNVANAQTTRTADGGPYQRQQVIFTPITPDAASRRLAAQQGDAAPDAGVRVTAIIEDDRPGRTVHDPTHPDADAEGMVQMPNVDIVTEMIDMMAATRAYEANLTVMQATKQMASLSLNIGR